MKRNLKWAVLPLAVLLCSQMLMNPIEAHAAAPLFVPGEDNWSFGNYASEFGRHPMNGYRIGESLMSVIDERFDHKERAVARVMENSSYMDGACHGLASMSVLAADDWFDPGTIYPGAEVLHDIPAQPGDQVVDTFFFFHYMQTTDVQAQLRRATVYKDELTKLNEITQMLADGSPVLVSVQHPGSTGHVVVVYDVEYGEFQQDGKTYDARFLTYDNKSPDHSDSYDIMFDTKTGSWSCNNFNTENNEYIIGYTDDPAMIDPIGFFHPESRAPMWESYIAQITTYGYSPYMTLYKTVRTGDTWTAAAVPEEEIAIPPSDTQRTEINLKDSTSAYQFSGAVPGDLVMDFEETRFTVNSSGAGRLILSPEKEICAYGLNSGYTLEMLHDRPDMINHWYKINLSGDVANSLDLRQTAEGYVLEADNLSGVQFSVEAEGGGTFSAELEPSFEQMKAVLFYELNDGSIGIKGDSDGDGSFEQGSAIDTADQLAGDINLDGVQDMADAVLHAQFVAGMVELSEAARALADCNADEEIDAKDTRTLIQRLSDGA